MPLPPAFAGWTAAVPVKAAVVPGELALATIEPGRGVRATLSPAEAVRYPIVPGHPGEPGTMGGMLEFAVSRAGTYRIALGASAWIDVVRDSHALSSIAHDHGPECSPIRKTVDFTLAPGRYLLAVSGNKTATLALMVVPILA